MEPFVGTLRDGSQIAANILLPEEARQLAEKAAPFQRPKGIPKEYGVTFVPGSGYILSDRKDSLLIPSLDDLQRFASDLANHSARPVLAGLNPYGREFPSHVDDLIRDYLKELEIDPSLGREARFSALARRFRALGVKRIRRVRSKYLLAEIALLGQALVEQFNGQWTMLLEEDDETFTPQVTVDGRSIYLAADV